MAIATQPRGYLDRPRPSGLADVIEVILDKGIVIDAYVRVSLIGIEILTIDARIVIASVDTYLRFAEAVNRLDIVANADSEGLPELVESMTESGAKSKTKGVVEGAKDAIGRATTTTTMTTTTRAQEPQPPALLVVLVGVGARGRGAGAARDRPPRRSTSTASWPPRLRAPEGERHRGGAGAARRARRPRRARQRPRRRRARRRPEVRAHWRVLEEASRARRSCPPASGWSWRATTRSATACSRPTARADGAPARARRQGPADASRASTTSSGCCGDRAHDAGRRRAAAPASQRSGRRGLLRADPSRRARRARRSSVGARPTPTVALRRLDAAGGRGARAGGRTAPTAPSTSPSWWRAMASTPSARSCGPSPRSRASGSSSATSARRRPFSFAEADLTAGARRGPDHRPADAAARPGPRHGVDRRAARGAGAGRDLRRVGDRAQGLSSSRPRARPARSTRRSS